MGLQSDLVLQGVGLGIAIRCEHPPTMDVLRDHFGAMQATGMHPDLWYDVSAGPDGWRIARERTVVGRAADVGGLLYLLDADLTIQLQLLRPDLLFLHAAAMTRHGGAHLLVGRSGAGKSTTCWGLLHHGFGYLSDELAPIDLPALTVIPYPRALGLKRPPPDAYALPDSTPRHSRGLDIPVRRIPRARPATAAPIRTLLFVEYDRSRPHPAARPIRRAEAGARLYPNVLNALAHPGDAMAAVTRVVAAAHAFVIDAADLTATCTKIDAVIRDGMRADHQDGPARPATSSNVRCRLPSKSIVAPSSSSPSSAATSRR